MRIFLSQTGVVLAAGWLLIGCVASGSSVLTGSKRAPLDPAVVEIYAGETPPPRYELVGQIGAMCGSGLTKESSRNYALEELKLQAAKLGANAVLFVETVDLSSRKSGTKLSVSAQAATVLPSAMSAEHARKVKQYEMGRRRSKSLFQAIAGDDPTPKSAAVSTIATGSAELFEVLTENAARAYESGDYPSAAAQYERAVRLRSNDPQVNYNLATVYFQLGKYLEAKPYYQAAAHLTPADPDTHLFLGFTHFYLKDTPAAIREWKKVLELDPANPAAREGLESVGIVTPR